MSHFQLHNTTLLLIALVLLLPSCKTTNPKDPVSYIDLDTVVFRAVKVDENNIFIESYDPADVFQQATADFDSQKYERALDSYVIIIEYFKDTPYYVPALYNAGLCLEFLEKYKESAQYFEELMRFIPGKADAKDAAFHLAECYEKMGKHNNVAALMHRILKRSDLTLKDRVEGHVRMGRAYTELREYSKAEGSYKKAMSVSDKSEAPLVKDHHLLAESHYGLGVIYHRMFSEIKLKLPVKAMKRDFNDKMQLFEQAQNYYIESIRHKNVYWASLSGFMVGQIFEDFHHDILYAEVPKDLTWEQVEIYFEELRKMAKPLLAQAIGIYEKTVVVAARVGLDNEWVQKSHKRLDAIRLYLYDENIRKEEEKQILEIYNVIPLESSPDDPEEPVSLKLEINIAPEKQILSFAPSTPAPKTTRMERKKIDQEIN